MSDLAALLHEEITTVLLQHGIRPFSPAFGNDLAARLAAHGVIVAPDLLAAARAVDEAWAALGPWVRLVGDGVQPRAGRLMHESVRALRAAIEEAKA